MCSCLANENDEMLSDPNCNLKEYENTARENKEIGTKGLITVSKLLFIFYQFISEFSNLVTM